MFSSGMVFSTWKMMPCAIAQRVLRQHAFELFEKWRAHHWPTPRNQISATESDDGHRDREADSDDRYG